MDDDNNEPHELEAERTYDIEKAINPFDSETQQNLNGRVVNDIPLNKSTENPSRNSCNEIQGNKTMTNRGICLFVANICLVNMFYMILTAYTNGIVRTLERRFGLSSYQTGFLNSCNDIVHIMVVVFVGYFGQKRNKPRIICVTAMFSAISGILNATPHFFFPDNTYPTEMRSLNNGLNNTINNLETSHSSFLSLKNDSLSSSKYCRSFPLENETDSFHNLCSVEKPSIHPAFYVFLVSQLINGVGSSAIFTLSMAYIDENSPKNKASIFIGAYTSFYSLGPVLGLFLSSVCLKLPENLFTGVVTNDPSFVGCWWLGYLVGGVGLGGFALLLWFHPSDSKSIKRKFKTDENSKEMKVLTDSDDDDDVNKNFLTETSTSF